MNKQLRTILEQKAQDLDQEIDEISLDLDVAIYRSEDQRELDFQLAFKQGELYAVRSILDLRTSLQDRIRGYFADQKMKKINKKAPFHLLGGSIA